MTLLLTNVGEISPGAPPVSALFCAVSNSGSGDRVMTSPDGSAWTIRSSAADNGWRSVCSNG